MNTLEEVQAAITEAATRHRFWCVGTDSHDIPHIMAYNVKFNFTHRVTSDIELMKTDRVRLNYMVSASVSGVDGNHTVEELAEIADEIHRGMELLKELQAMKISYVREI